MRLLSLLVCLCLAGIPSLLVAEDKVKMVSKNDQAMNKAFKKAEKSERLAGFLRKVNKKPANLSDFSAYIKVEDNDETEYLWIADFQKYNEEYYMGVVVSKPGLVTNVKYGATIGVKQSDIYDWQYYNNKTKKTFGAYTTCVLLKKRTKEDIKYIQENGLQCDFK